MLIIPLLFWSTFEPTTLDAVRKQHVLTVLTDKNCLVCESYIKEIIKCSEKTHTAVVAAGDNNYLRTLRQQLPDSVSLLKATQKQLAQVTKLTPTTFINEKKRDGFITCQDLQQEVKND